MSLKQKTVWALLHIAAIAAVLVSLASGLRIAVLEYPFLLRLHYLLPQGEMHSLHIYSAWLLSLVAFIYTGLLLYRYLPNTENFNRQKISGLYHWLLAWWLRITLVILLLSGWLLYLEVSTVDISLIKLVHLMGAGLIALYLVLHVSGYYLQHGVRIVRRILLPVKFVQRNLLLTSVVLMLAGTGSVWVLVENHQHQLMVSSISPDIYIQIDGNPDESVWQQAESFTIQTHGGANFNQGATPVTIKALQNGQDAFFHFRWQDDTESLQHLPLKKTEQGWQVQQDGFKDFDERTFYEDKFAVILSDSCELNAAGTAHLGPKPLSDKPRHWTGKGYHYREKGLVDLWQWKAVRTNSMRLMDDNYIGQPAEPRVGERRYTAGYQQDARESGAYKMNWKWFYSDGVTPKRLPENLDMLGPYQPGSDQPITEMPWIIPWFDSRPYQQQNDVYPIGTIMPSILYSSNQFEGDRANVRAFASWAEGYWSLEVFRRLDTGSDKDIAIKEGICLWVAAFDHAQVAHTRHTRPIQLVMQ